MDDDVKDDAASRLRVVANGEDNGKPPGVYAGGVWFRIARRVEAEPSAWQKELAAAEAEGHAKYETALAAEKRVSEGAEPGPDDAALLEWLKETNKIREEPIRRRRFILEAEHYESGHEYYFDTYDTDVGLHSEVVTTGDRDSLELCRVLGGNFAYFVGQRLLHAGHEDVRARLAPLVGTWDLMATTFANLLEAASAIARDSDPELRKAAHAEFDDLYRGIQRIEQAIGGRDPDVRARIDFVRALEKEVRIRRGEDRFTYFRQAGAPEDWAPGEIAMAEFGANEYSLRLTLEDLAEATRVLADNLDGKNTPCWPVLARLVQKAGMGGWIAPDSLRRSWFEHKKRMAELRREHSEETDPPG